jgi:membrane protease YdiL (CAAX protease family)
VVDGRAGLHDLWHRVIRWRVPPLFWVLVAATLSLVLLGVIVPLLTGRDIPSLDTFGRYTGIASIGPLGVGGVALIVNGLGEETGWRGFAADRLLRTHSLTWTALVVALIWGGWHLPFFWMVAGFRGMGPLAVGWAVGLAAGSVVLTWLYREGRRSVLLVAAWHTAFNLTSATEATGAVVGTVTSLLVIGWALWVIRRERTSR